MKTFIFKRISMLFAVCFVLLSCNIKDKKTSIAVNNPNRHYYPIQRGQALDIVYEIENTGENPLLISDIHTSCGCVLIDESSFKMLPAKGKGFIRLKYDSKKNIGYVKHYIDIYANLENEAKHEITFDVNVVPNALYTRDYEELHNENKQRYVNEKDLVDGKENNKGYYVENHPPTY